MSPSHWPRGDWRRWMCLTWSEKEQSRQSSHSGIYPWTFLMSTRIMESSVCVPSPCQKFSKAIVWMVPLPLWGFGSPLEGSKKTTEGNWASELARSSKKQHRCRSWQRSVSLWPLTHHTQVLTRINLTSELPLKLSQEERKGMKGRCSKNWHSI